MRAAVWGAAAVVMVTVLGGCADLSGEVDDLGHNGYDQRTCKDFKGLAMDARYGVMNRTQGIPRVQRWVEESAKASDSEIRDAVQAYAAAYMADDDVAKDVAVSVLMKVCTF